MFFKQAVLSLGVGLMASLSAGAQVESESMSDLSVWGERLQAADERDFPNTLWSGSDTETLLAALASVRTENLTPAESMLLRRVVLSPARKPKGEGAEALLAARADILLALGEAEAAAAIVPRAPDDGATMSREAVKTDLMMARGNEASACGRLDSAVSNEHYWLKLRAVCAVLRGNVSGAELAVEVASTQGMDDPWFVASIFAAAGDTGLPEANFDSGLNMVLSLALGMDVSLIDTKGVRPDLAAAGATRPGMPIALRAQLAEHAAMLGRLPAEDWRAVLTEQAEQPEDEAESVNVQTFNVFQAPGASIGERAERLAETLSLASQQGVLVYASTARLYQEELETLAPVEPVTPYALLFARASLMAAHQPLAHHWLESIDTDGVAAPAPFDVAELEVMDLIFGGEASAKDIRRLERALLDTWTLDDEATAARRLLAAMSGLGYRLSPRARQFVAAGDLDAGSIGLSGLFDIKAAVNSGALAEASLMILSQTDGEPEKLSPFDLALLIDLLDQMDAGDIGAALALEANEIWLP